jgi:hypothetical protein
MKSAVRIALFSLLGLVTASCAAQSTAATTAQRAELESEMKAAIEKVQFLVNQPVEPLLRVGGMQISTYKPGWFHEGASKPDYNNVDIRRTQDVSYGKHEYVTSDLNPGIVFRGAEVEFNSMTKFFYTDRSLPKKRLTEAEMVEINRLYRIIGRCEDALTKL